MRWNKLGDGGGNKSNSIKHENISERVKEKKKHIKTKRCAANMIWYESQFLAWKKATIYDLRKLKQKQKLTTKRTKKWRIESEPLDVLYMYIFKFIYPIFNL